jgi:hypothetical protein
MLIDNLSTKKVNDTIVLYATLLVLLALIIIPPIPYYKKVLELTKNKPRDLDVNKASPVLLWSFASAVHPSLKVYGYYYTPRFSFL